jgi:hypothetical protein
MLEFEGEASVHIGSRSLALVDILDWSAEGISVDREALDLAAWRSDDLKSGNKRYVPSTSVRQDRKIATEIRNRQLQRRLSQLAAENPKLSKAQLAKKLSKSGGRGALSAETIARVTRMPRAKNT